MVDNTSATGGYLKPLADPNADLVDIDLENFLQEVVVGITGIPGKLVRPRWQPEPPNLPEKNVNWIALGITDWEKDTYGAVIHNPGSSTEEPYDKLIRHETLNLTVSFYGPKANSYCSLFDDGLLIAQNQELMKSKGFGHLGTGDSVMAPELVTEQWLYRIDLPWSLRRSVTRKYAVKNLEMGPIEVDCEPLAGPPLIIIDV